MTIDEAIKRTEEIASYYGRQYKPLYDNVKCARDHRQLAEWLKELKRHREAWDKVNEKIEKQEKWLLQAGVNSYNVDIFLNSLKDITNKQLNEIK